MIDLYLMTIIAYYFPLSIIIYAYVYFIFIFNVSHEHLPHFITFVSFVILSFFGLPLERMEYGQYNHSEIFFLHF